MQAQIEAGATSYDIAMRRYGFTAQEAKALLLGPIEGVVTDTPITEVHAEPVEVAP